MRPRPTTGCRTDADLRAEHDALASRLSARASIDDVRRGAYAAFAVFILSGLAGKIAWDRWGPIHPKALRTPPAVFAAVLAVAGICALVAVRSFLRARRRMREEDAEYARFQELRRRLGLDP